MRREPAPEPFGVEHGAVNRVVITHRTEGVGKLALERQVEIGPRREHAVMIGRRGPYLAKPTFGNQVLAAHRIPERAADCAGVGSPVEYRADDFHFAGPRVTVLAHVAVEAQE